MNKYPVVLCDDAKQRYARMWALTGKQELPNDYSAAFYLLSQSDAIACRVYGAVSFDGIDFEKILAGDLSSGEMRLVRVAFSLFSHEQADVSVYELILLDHDVLKLVFEAIGIEKGLMRVHC